MPEIKPVPQGFNTLSVYLVVPNAVEAIAFYAAAFGAEEGMRLSGPDGKSTVHAEMRLGDSTFMLTDENPQWNAKSPLTLGGSGASLHIYVEDAEAAFQRALDAGCTEIFPMEDTFWGDRYGKLQDPYGHQWGIATHREDVSDEELQKRADQYMAGLAEGGC